jgi:hypothetical protein
MQAQPQTHQTYEGYFDNGNFYRGGKIFRLPEREILKVVVPMVQDEPNEVNDIAEKKRHLRESNLYVAVLKALRMRGGLLSKFVMKGWESTLNILIDTNIVIDYFSDNSFSKQAEQVIEICSDGKATGFMNASSVTDVYYILRKKIQARRTD